MHGKLPLHQLLTSLHKVLHYHVALDRTVNAQDQGLKSEVKAGHSQGQQMWP